MEDIEKRFIEKNLKNKYHGAYINLVSALRGRRFSRKSLVRAFKKIVPPREYRKSGTLELIGYLELVANSPKEVKKSNKN